MLVTIAIMHICALVFDRNAISRGILILAVGSFNRSGKGRVNLLIINFMSSNFDVNWFYFFNFTVVPCSTCGRYELNPDDPKKRVQMKPMCDDFQLLLKFLSTAPDNRTALPWLSASSSSTSTHEWWKPQVFPVFGVSTFKRRCYSTASRSPEVAWGWWNAISGRRKSIFGNEFVGHKEPQIMCVGGYLKVLPSGCNLIWKSISAHDTRVVSVLGPAMMGVGGLKLSAFRIMKHRSEPSSRLGVIWNGMCYGGKFQNSYLLLMRSYQYGNYFKSADYSNILLSITAYATWF